MEYEVKVKGTEDVERLGRSIESLESVLKSARGSGKSLEELRKIITGFKGQAGVFHELRDSMKAIPSAAAAIEKSMQGVGTSISRTLKSEFELTRATLRTEIMTLLKGIGSPLAAKIEGEVGGAMAQGIERSGTRAKSAAAKVRAEMTKQYEALVGGDGFKQLSKDDLGEVALLKGVGATISPFHAAMLKNEIASVKNQRKVLETFAEVEASKVKVAQASVEKQLQVDRMFAQAQAAHDAKLEAAARKRVEEERAAKEKQLQVERTFNNAIAADNAKRLKEEESQLREMARIRATFAKSAQESAERQLQVDRAFDQAQRAHTIKVEAAAAKHAESLQKAREKELQVERLFNNAMAAEQAKRIEAEERTQRELARVRMTFAQAYAEYQASQIRKSVSAAMNAADAPYQKYNATTGLAGSVANMPKTSPKAPVTSATGGGFDTGKTKQAAADLKTFAVNAGDAHAAVRGLASGFNLLWLTWGNLGPLMAGAALSNTFMKAAKEGMEVAHTLEIIKVLGEASGAEIDRLGAAMEHLGTTSVFGPKATAEAMQTLVLAGVKAADVVDQIANVQNFSIAGTTSIQNASDVLVSVTTAFGTGAAGIQKSSDIIVRAAADSKASVESFGEAMKTASVVGEQYGAAQEDVAALISMMANLGIQGTAAGTAIRNMYTDLSGRTPKVAKALKDMNLDFRNTDGSMKPLLQTTQELDAALKRIETKDPKRAKDFLATILSERGGKAAVAALADYNQKIEVAGTITSALEVRLNKLGQAAGTTGLAAAQLAETTQSAWKRVGATLETSLEKAFKQMEPQLYSMAGSLQALFNSPEFVSSVATIASSIAGIGEAVASNSKVILSAIAVWGSYKLATALMLPAWGASVAAIAGVGAAFRGTSAITAAATATTAANTGAVVANTAAQALSISTAGKVAGGMGAILRVLPVVGLALTAATVAWDAYGYAKSRANGGTALAVERSNNVISTLTKETEALKARTKAIREGENMQVYDALSDKGKEIDAATAKLRERIADATKKIADEEARRAKIIQQNGGETNDPRARSAAADPVIDAIDQSIAAQKRLRAEAQNNLSTMTEGWLRARGEFIAASTVAQEATEEAARKDAKLKADAYKKYLSQYGITNEGPDDFGTTGPNRFGGGRGPSAAQTYYDTDFELFKKKSEAQKALNETYYQQGRLSAEQYYNFLEIRAQEAYQAEKAALEAKLSALKGDKGSTKEYQKTAVDLEVLDINRTAELAKLEHDRTKAVQERLTASQKMQAFANDYLSSLEGDGSAIAAIKYGSEQAQIETARAKIHKDFAKQRIDLEKAFIQESKGLSLQATLEKVGEYNQQLQMLQSYEDQALQIKARGIEAERLERLKASNGVTRAVNSYVSAAADMASQAENLTASALKSIEDGFVSLATKGKLSFTDMANSIIADMARIAAKQLTSGLSGILGGGLNSLIGGMFGGGTSGFSTGQGVMDALTSMNVFAKGAAFSGSPSLSQYSNTVQSSPKLFAFANGGVFGEAGPEAVMPLTRGADGNLGVRQFGGGAGTGSVIVNLEVVQNGMEKTTNRTEQSKDDQGNILIRLIQNTVSDDIAGGGKISRSIKQRFSLKG